MLFAQVMTSILREVVFDHCWLFRRAGTIPLSFTVQFRSSQLFTGSQSYTSQNGHCKMLHSKWNQISIVRPRLHGEKCDTVYPDYCRQSACMCMWIHSVYLCTSMCAIAGHPQILEFVTLRKTMPQRNGYSPPSCPHITGSPESPPQKHLLLL